MMQVWRFRLFQQSLHGLATQNSKTFLPKSLETRSKLQQHNDVTRIVDSGRQDFPPKWSDGFRDSRNRHFSWISEIMTCTRFLFSPRMLHVHLKSTVTNTEDSIDLYGVKFPWLCSSIWRSYTMWCRVAWSMDSTASENSVLWRQQATPKRCCTSRKV